MKPANMVKFECSFSKNCRLFHTTHCVSHYTPCFTLHTVPKEALLDIFDRRVPTLGGEGCPSTGRQRLCCKTVCLPGPTPMPPPEKQSAAQKKGWWWRQRYNDIWRWWWRSWWAWWYQPGNGQVKSLEGPLEFYYPGQPDMTLVAGSVNVMGLLVCREIWCSIQRQMTI